MFCRQLRYFLATFLLLIIHSAFAANDNVVNVYTWSQELPSDVIKAFEHETGIRVNYSTFDSNEMMFAKLRASNTSSFDLIEPSSYYIDRMRHQNMLTKLDRSKLSNFSNLDPAFLNRAYDPKSAYSVPFIWGVTGIFLNKGYFTTTNLAHWSDLLDKKYLNQLMVLDDPRESFSMALLMLGYSINDTDPAHIKQAYLKLRKLMPNIRLFNTDAVISIIIDEDATIGLAWNGDLFKATAENSKLKFIYPHDGFEIWVDNFAIVKNSPHEENAYKFLNFLMRADIAKAVSLKINYATANLAAKNLLPVAIKNNTTLYPSYQTLAHGQFQTDIGDATFALLEKYWEQLKMGA
jgi:spermidine/putrescine transport system substrate-binding protein